MQLSLFECGDDSTSEKPKRSRRHRRRAAQRYIQRSLFDKHVEPLTDHSMAARERRLTELMDLPEYALTADELSDLDAYVAERCQEIQSGWSARTEAKRRGYKAGWSKSDVFEDGHGRILYRLDCEPVTISPQDDSINTEE